jgi:hypothetical protein
VHAVGLAGAVAIKCQQGMKEEFCVKFVMSGHRPCKDILAESGLVIRTLTEQLCRRSPVGFGYRSQVTKSPTSAMAAMAGGKERESAGHRSISVQRKRLMGLGSEAKAHQGPRSHDSAQHPWRTLASEDGQGWERRL